MVFVTGLIPVNGICNKIDLFNCIDMLKRLDCINAEPSENRLSTKAVSLATEIAETVIKISQEMLFAEEEEYFMHEEHIDDEFVEEVAHPTVNESQSSSQLSISGTI